jgi:hypothetical protein
MKFKVPSSLTSLVVVYDIVRNVRKRKGLVEDIPGLDKYYDKL